MYFCSSFIKKNRKSKNTNDMRLADLVVIFVFLVLDQQPQMEIDSSLISFYWIYSGNGTID